MIPIGVVSGSPAKHVHSDRLLFNPLRRIPQHRINNVVQKCRVPIATAEQRTHQEPCQLVVHNSRRNSIRTSRCARLILRLIVLRIGIYLGLICHPAPAACLSILKQLHHKVPGPHGVHLDKRCQSL
jgi:hypothetical protein